jgi:apolipoprotein D and lipocalin family protein
MNRAFIITIIFVSMFTNCRTQSLSVTVDKSTVGSVDINRYLGKWYEIARFDHSFERGLTGVTATYSIRPDGKIKVLNEGYKNSLDGRHKKAVGKAYIPDPANTARLKVSFFLNFYADYLVMDLDEADYQYAMIGSNSDKFIWILSRTPVMPEATYQKLVERARARGYAVNNLIRVPQRGN